jgi:hypothetical protein
MAFFAVFLELAFEGALRDTPGFFAGFVSLLLGNDYVFPFYIDMRWEL